MSSAPETTHAEDPAQQIAEATFTTLGVTALVGLLLGVAAATSSVHAILLPHDAPAANELRAKDLTPYGALSIWELTDDASAGPPRESSRRA